MAEERIRPDKDGYLDIIRHHLHYLEHFNLEKSGSISTIDMDFLKLVHDAQADQFMSYEEEDPYRAQIPDLDGMPVHVRAAAEPGPHPPNAQPRLLIVPKRFQHIARQLFHDQKGEQRIMIIHVVWSNQHFHPAISLTQLETAILKNREEYEARQPYQSLAYLHNPRSPIPGNKIIHLGGSFACKGQQQAEDPGRFISYFVMRDLIRLMDPYPTNVAKFFLEAPGEHSESEYILRRTILGLPPNDSTYNPGIQNNEDISIYDAFEHCTPLTVLVMIEPKWPARQYLASVMNDLTRDGKAPKAIVCTTIDYDDHNYDCGPDGMDPDPSAPIVRTVFANWLRCPINEVVHPNRHEKIGNVSLYLRPVP